MRGFNLCLRALNVWTAHPRCERDHCRLETGFWISISFTSCFGTTLWLSKYLSPARVQFSRSHYRTSLCQPLARGACCPQGRGYDSVGPPLSLATPLRTHYTQQLCANTWIIVIILWATSFVTCIWWTKLSNENWVADADYVRYRKCVHSTEVTNDVAKI